MRFLIIALMLVLACAGSDEVQSASTQMSGAEPELLGSYYEDGAPMWVGSVESSHLKQSPFSEWYDPEYEGYTPKAESLTVLVGLLDGVDIEVYFGTWCGDSQQEVPRLNRILDDVGFPAERLEMIALSDLPGEFKLSPAGKEQARLVHRTPTIIMVRDGHEVGRIVQYVVEGLEADMITILRGEAYVPRFGAESRLHEIVASGGIQAFEEDTSGLANELRELGDSDSLWHYARFDLLFNRKPQAAETVLDAFLQLHPESARGHFLMAQAHRDLGDLDQALIDVRRSLDYDADNAMAREFEAELVERS